MKTRPNNLTITQIIVTAAIIAAALSGCGSIHSTRTPAGEADGVVPAASSHTGNTGVIGPTGGQAVEMEGVSSASSTPVTAMSLPSGVSIFGPGDFSAEGLELTTPDGTFRADRLNADSSRSVSALAGQLAALSSWVAELADAQKHRDEVRAKVATDAIAAIFGQLKIFFPAP